MIVQYQGGQGKLNFQETKVYKYHSQEEGSRKVEIVQKELPSQIIERSIQRIDTICILYLADYLVLINVQILLTENELNIFFFNKRIFEVFEVIYFELIYYIILNLSGQHNYLTFVYIEKMITTINLVNICCNTQFQKFFV